MKKLISSAACVLFVMLATGPSTVAAADPVPASIAYDDPHLFNTTVERFLTTPFKKLDHIADTMASFERLVTELPN